MPSQHNPRRSNRIKQPERKTPNNSRKRIHPNHISPEPKNKQTKGTKKHPLPVDLEQDDMSVDTVEANNESTSYVSSEFVTFLSFQATVTASTKGSATMRDQFQTLFKIIQDADAGAALSVYKTTITYDDERTPTPILEKYVLDDPNDIPESITAMSKFFFGARPNSKGGQIWSQIRLLHNADIDNIIADTRDDFMEKRGRISKQSIQHWDVESLGFLKNVHPDVDVVNLNEYLSDALTRMNKKVPLKLGLKVKTPWDGKKRDPKAKTTHFRDRIQAVHCEVEGAQKSLTGKLIKLILSSADFQLRYKCDVRLVPNFNRNSGPYIQDKIRRCIVQHGQFCKCVNSNTCEGIEFLDVKNSTLQRTLRQLIMDLPDANFINIDLNWSNTAYAIIYPKKHEEVAQERIANLGPYLHKAYGDAILSSLPADMQEAISEVTWDEETGRPLTKLDRELDDILENGKNMDYVDLSLFTEVEDRPVAPSNTFIPQLDAGSVSTFGTIRDTHQANTASLSRKRSTASSASSVISAVTLDSRISTMESSFNKMETMLTLLVGRMPPPDSTVTSPPIINSADTANPVSATGV